MKIMKKEYVLPLIMVLFLVVVFLDQNNIPIPMKILVGSPIHMSLSMVIMVSMLVGAGLAFVGLLFFGKIKNKFKKNGERD